MDDIGLLIALARALHLEFEQKHTFFKKKRLLSLSVTFLRRYFEKKIQNLNYDKVIKKKGRTKLAVICPGIHFVEITHFIPGGNYA